MIKRDIEQEISKYLYKGKAIVIMGARQVGKTTLLESLFGDEKGVLWLNGDEAGTKAVLGDDLSKQSFLPYAKGSKIIIIDEAQRIRDIGIKLKILQDAYKKDVQIIATGSSSFDLANKINEPLTGRKWEFKMFPLKFSEMAVEHGLLAERQSLDTRLRFGYYPEVVTNPGDEQAILRNLADDNLYKDVYKFEEIRKPEAFESLARALAFQIGSEVNVSELSALLGLDHATVKKYLRLLEQSYTVFRLGPYSANLRNEIKSSSKYYFYDVGLRNALIGAFEPVSRRTDIGHLFENFVVAEFAKKLMPKAVGSFAYFWRTKQGGEIDFVRADGYDVSAYEIRWNPKSKGKFPKPFIEKYLPTKCKTLHRDNFFEELI
jgi:predicted AAA+ superfamily ATPase